MKINAPLALFLIGFLFIFPTSFYAQSSGGWGTCEFSTVATMNSFDPSSSNFACKKAFVQATDEHYRWNGTAWVLESVGTENIYNTSDTLTENRVVTMDGNNLTFDGTKNIDIQDNGRIGIGTSGTVSSAITIVNDANSFNDDDIEINTHNSGGTDYAPALVFKRGRGTYASPTNVGLGDRVGRLSFNSYINSAGYSRLSYIDSYYQGSGTDSRSDLVFGTSAADRMYLDADGNLGIGTTTVDARLDVEGGTVRFSEYGSGTYDTGNETYILGVEADGDVVEVTASSLGDNLGNHIATENIQTNDNWLSNDGDNEGVYVEADGDVGIGTSSPTGQLQVVNGDNVDAFNFVSSNVLTGERDVFTIEDQDVGGGGQDHSSVLKVYKSASINTGDDGFSLAELTYTGTDPSNGKYWISGRKANEGAPEWGVNISDNQIWSTGGLLLNATGATAGTYSGGNFIVEPGGDVGIGTTTPDARLDVEGGSVRFTDYGVGTYDTGNETYLLGVEADGDVVEIDKSTLGGGNNIYNSNGTLTAERTVTMANNDLKFDMTGTGDFLVLDNGTVALAVENQNVGIGEEFPDAPLHIVETTGTTASANDGTIILEHDNSGGSNSIVFKSRVNAGSDFGYIEYSDDGSGNGSTTENSLLTIGTQNDGLGIYQDDIAILPSGNLGVGTTSPDAKLDVEGGSVRLSDYGGGTYLDQASTTVPASATYMLGVEADGDVVSINTAKSAKIFYPPAISINVSAISTGNTLDLHQVYVNLFSSPAVVSSGAPSAIPYYAETELFYYITDYDTAVFSGLNINANGLLTYNVISVPSDNCSVFNVVFVVK